MAELILTTNEQVKLSAKAIRPDSETPSPLPLTWTSSDPTKVGLLFPDGGDDTVIALGLAVAASTTITVTDGTLNATFTIQTVSPDVTALDVFQAGPVEAQDSKQRNRGRGHGIGYQ